MFGHSNIKHCIINISFTSFYIKLAISFLYTFKKGDPFFLLIFWLSHFDKRSKPYPLINYVNHFTISLQKSLPLFTCSYIQITSAFTKLFPWNLRNLIFPLKLLHFPTVNLLPLKNCSTIDPLPLACSSPILRNIQIQFLTYLISLLQYQLLILKHIKLEYS